MWNSLLERRQPEIFNGLDIKSLDVDQCYLKIISQTNQHLSLYQRSSLCHKCPYVRSADLFPGQVINKTYDSNPYWNFLISSSEETYVSSSHGDPNMHCFLESVDFGEFGVYELNITDQKCMLETVKDPVFKYAALFWVFGVLFICFLFYVLFDYLLRRKWRKSNHSEDHDHSEIEISKSELVQPKQRIKSLDAFRGLTIMVMMLINYGGGKFWFFHHAPWDGLHPGDLVFPWFVWIMGVCIPFSISSQLKKSSRCKILLNILIRSVKLFAIGIVINSIGGHNELTTYRVPGVLQRLALGYWIGASIYCLTYFSRLTSEKESAVQKFFSHFDDVISLIPQWFIYFLLTGAYLAVVFLLPVPGCPTGYLGPSGLSLFQNNSLTVDCVGGATGYVDRLILGNNHIYQWPTSRGVYESGAFDPEGILGVLPTALQVFLGIQAGQVMVNHSTHKGRLLRWVFWGIVYAVVGLGLSGGTLMGHPIPVNKNLWSLSFVFITTSFAFLFLFFSYLCIDQLQFLSGAPFYQTGMNCIFLYIGHFFTYNVFPWQFNFSGEFETHIGLFSEAMCATLLWVLIALYMHWRKIFIII